jgi:hypothetical protein
MLTALQGWVSNVLHHDPKGEKCEETIGALEDGTGDEHLVTSYC